MKYVRCQIPVYRAVALKLSAFDKRSWYARAADVVADGGGGDPALCLAEAAQRFVLKLTSVGSLRNAKVFINISDT